ncbi:MAG: biotin--[acetyl-CoA-carboxylase] ligase [Gammaproteobacteria bacterium]|nr:biotin--[acetyl-CoA-carboxylase] ligase [Gammaproteobacteria bacterium]
MILLNKEAILPLVDERLIDIAIVKSINSTNNFFDQQLPSQKFSACFAEEQTQGRGQLQRVWHSPFAENIYFSLCYFSSQPLMLLSGLSLVAGYAVCDLLNTSFSLPEPALIKWPNDILCKNLKLSGVLIETEKMPDQTRRVVIGIGLNVNMQSAAEAAISQNWTSLAQLTGATYDRNIICAKLINHLLASIHLFEKEGLVNFVLKWNKYNALLNKVIRLSHNKKITTGKCVGLSSQGELILELPNSEIRKFLSGEAFLQK